MCKEQRVVIKLFCMINASRQVFQVSCCLCNKKANLYRIYGVMEGKKKRQLEMHEDQRGLLPILGPLS